MRLRISAADAHGCGGKNKSILPLSGSGANGRTRRNAAAKQTRKVLLFLRGKKQLSYRKHCLCEKVKVLSTQVPEDRRENASVSKLVRASPAEEAESLTKDFLHRPDLLGKPKASGPLFLLHPQGALLFLGRRKRRGGCKKAFPARSAGKTRPRSGRKASPGCNPGNLPPLMKRCYPARGARA